jgi:hypothetical protein
MNTAATAVSAIFGNAQNHPIDLVNLATILGSGAASGSTEWNYPTASPGIPDVDNQVIRISMDNNGSGNLTGGNAANTLRVTLYYVAEPV